MKKLIFMFALLLFLAACGSSNYNVEQTVLDGNDVIYAGDDWFDAGCFIEATHKSDETLNTTETVFASTQDLSEPGLYVVNYSYELEGNVYGCNRQVVVIDNSSPDVELNPGVDTVFIGETHTDAGVTATDNQSEDLQINIENRVDTTLAGVYEIIYTVTDLDGNQVQLTRMVTVKNPE